MLPISAIQVAILVWSVSSGLYPNGAEGLTSLGMSLVSIVSPGNHVQESVDVEIVVKPRARTAGRARMLIA